MSCEALLKAQVLENDGPYITIVSIIFDMKFRFYKIKSHTHTNACLNRAVFLAFSTSERQILCDLLMYDNANTDPI